MNTIKERIEEWKKQGSNERRFIRYVGPAQALQLEETMLEAKAETAAQRLVIEAQKEEIRRLTDSLAAAHTELTETRREFKAYRAARPEVRFKKFCRRMIKKIKFLLKFG